VPESSITIGLEDALLLMVTVPDLAPWDWRERNADGATLARRYSLDLVQGLGQLLSWLYRLGVNPHPESCSDSVLQSPPRNSPGTNGIMPCGGKCR